MRVRSQLKSALAKGWLDDIDVVQLAAKSCVADPALVAELRSRGKAVVANSLIRHKLGQPSEEVTEAAVQEAVAELLQACPTLDVVLAGTSNEGRLKQLAVCVGLTSVGDRF